MSPQKEQRYLELLRLPPPLLPVERVERDLLRSSPPFKMVHDGRTFFFLDQGVDVKSWPTYGGAMRERFRRLMDDWSRLPGGLEAVRPGFPKMPVALRTMVEARLRKISGTPRRKGWKWNAESRARLSRARTGKKDAAPRKRGYPLFELSPGFTLPPDGKGKRYTVTFETLAELRGMIFPEGM